MIADMKRNLNPRCIPRSEPTTIAQPVMLDIKHKL